MIFRQFPFRKFETAGENCKQNPERQHDHNDLAHGCAVNLKRTKRAERSTRHGGEHADRNDLLQN